MANQKNESELLFEEYLRSQNLTFEYEKPRDFSTNLIDYTVRFDNREFLFEVKEFEPLDYPVGTVFAFDPYKEIRAKIHEAQKQFRDYGDFACSIVLCNLKNALVQLSENHVMLGAMYGDAGLTMKVDLALGRAVGPLEPAFLGRGKMIRPKTQEPQNTRVSALIALREYHVGGKRLYKHIKEKRFSSPEEEWDYICEISGKLEFTETRLCTIVWDNAYAKRPLPDSLFRGDFDIRWGIEGENQKITYAGPGIAEFID